MKTLKSRFISGLAALVVLAAAPGIGRADQASDRITAANLCNIFVQALNTQNVGLLDQVFPENYIQHNPDVPPGRAGVKNLFAEEFKTTKQKNIQFTVAIEDIVVDGDHVVLRQLTTIKKDGKTYESRGFDEWRLANGQFVEHWDGDGTPHEVK